MDSLIAYLDDLPPISPEQNKSEAAREIYAPLLVEVDRLTKNMVGFMESMVQQILSRVSAPLPGRPLRLEAASDSLKALIVCLEQLNAEGTPMVKHILSGYKDAEGRTAATALALGHLRTGLIGALAAILAREKVPEDLMSIITTKCRHYLSRFTETSSFESMKVILAQNTATMRNIPLRYEELSSMKTGDIAEWNQKLWKFISDARTAPVPYAVVQEESIVAGKAHWLFDENVLGSNEEIVKTDFASVALVVGDMAGEDITRMHEAYVASNVHEEIDGREYLIADNTIWQDKALVMHLNNQGHLERGVLFTDALRLSLGEKTYEVLRASILLHLTQLTCRDGDIAVFLQDKGIVWEQQVPGRRQGQSRKKKRQTKFSEMAGLARKYFPNLDGQGSATHTDKEKDVIDDEQKVFRMYNQSFYMPLLKAGYNPSQRAKDLAKDAGITLSGALVAPDGTRMSALEMHQNAKNMHLEPEVYKEQMIQQGWVWRLRTFAKINPERVRKAVIAQERQELAVLDMLREGV